MVPLDIDVEWDDQTSTRRKLYVPRRASAYSQTESEKELITHCVLVISLSVHLLSKQILKHCMQRQAPYNVVPFDGVPHTTLP